jgi:hypothetical protein
MNWTGMRAIRGVPLSVQSKVIQLSVITLIQKVPRRPSSRYTRTAGRTDLLCLFRSLVGQLDLGGQHLQAVIDAVHPVTHTIPRRGVRRDYSFEQV